jgi:hypothetical protein
MKKFYLVCLLMHASSSAISQNETLKKTSDWEISVEANFYFTDPFFILPIVTAEKDKLHLEARYAYEDLKSASLWVGINFSGGKKFKYNITPMLGSVIGRANGIAPGLEVTLSFDRFEFYTEMEYVFSFESKENNYFYSWTDFTFAPLDWLYFGVSGQRIKAYETDKDLQYGLIAGNTFKQFDLSAHFFNPATDEFFTIITLGCNF